MHCERPPIKVQDDRFGKEGDRKAKKLIQLGGESGAPWELFEPASASRSVGRLVRIGKERREDKDLASAIACAAGIGPHRIGMDQGPPQMPGRGRITVLWAGVV
jgi:hypothetical protein